MSGIVSKGAQGDPFGKGGCPRHDYCVKHGLDCLVAEHIQTANP